MFVLGKGLNRWKLRLKYLKLKIKSTGFKKNYSWLKRFSELENRLKNYVECNTDRNRNHE